MVISTESVSSRGERGIQELPSPNSRVLLRLGVRAFSARQNPSVPDLRKLESDSSPLKSAIHNKTTRQQDRVPGLTKQGYRFDSGQVHQPSQFCSHGSASFGFTINAGITVNTLMARRAAQPFPQWSLAMASPSLKGRWIPALSVSSSPRGTSGAGTTHLPSTSFLQTP
jgi:hypothetical protein